MKEYLYKLEPKFMIPAGSYCKRPEQMDIFRRLIWIENQGEHTERFQELNPGRLLESILCSSCGSNESRYLYSVRDHNADNTYAFFCPNCLTDGLRNRL